MSNNSFWQGILTALKTIIADIEKGLERVGKLFGEVIDQIVTAEEGQIMLDAKPLIQQVAINLQNEKPGLNARDFIAALIEASIPVLQAEGLKLAHTATAIVAATVSHQLGIGDATGNSGTVS